MSKRIKRKKLKGSTSITACALMIGGVLVFHSAFDSEAPRDAYSIESDEIVGSEEDNRLVDEQEVEVPAEVQEVESQVEVEEVERTLAESEGLIVEEVPSENIQEEIETSILGFEVSDNTLTYNGVAYSILSVDGGERSGERQSLAAVDIGFGERKYWGLTNEYGQLIYVLADEIVLQNDETEEVNSDGRYYVDEAHVAGTEKQDLDQGHIIADSLGGVANAYNITPQDAVLNRHGDQAYMEAVIRDAGGCKEFVATITYPDTTTQIPSKYRYEYLLKGNKIIDEFENKNPEANNADASTDEAVDAMGEEVGSGGDVISNATANSEDVSQVDANGNGKVTISEAKEAGYAMPITSDHWLYPYMDDRDGDGMVGE